MLRKLLVAAALGTTAIATGALAQATLRPEGSKPVARAEVSAEARAAMHVNARVLEDLTQLVPDEETRAKMMLRMVILAKQEAIAGSCAGHDLDQQRMFTLMYRTTMPLLDHKTPKDARTANLDRALRQYNTLLGSELAQFSFNPREYCDYARTLMEDLSGYSEAETMLVLKRS
ncbi:MAG: hypothetical protein ACK4IS_06755 [Erythrobacter sp.]